MPVRSYRYRLLEIIVGSLISAIGINMFVVPNHLLAGGVSGISLLLYYLFGLPVSVMLIVINIPIFILGFWKLHYGYVMRSLLGLGSLSLFIALTRPIVPAVNVNDLLLAAIFGGVMQGFGYGLVFRGRGSTGGADIISLILRRKWSTNVGATNFIMNAVIMACSTAFFDVRLVGYTLISMYISGVVLDKVQLGFDRAKNVLIVSDRANEVTEAILHRIGRGVTILKGKGAYSHAEKEVLMTSITITQLAKLKDVVYEEDPGAFVTVWEASEVLGRGFKPSPAKERSELELNFNLKKWEEKFQHKKLKASKAD